MLSFLMKPSIVYVAPILNWNHSRFRFGVPKTHRDSLETRALSISVKPAHPERFQEASMAPSSRSRARRGCNVVILDKRVPGDTHCVGGRLFSVFLRRRPRVAGCSRVHAYIETRVRSPRSLRGELRYLDAATPSIVGNFRGCRKILALRLPLRVYVITMQRAAGWAGIALSLANSV